MRSSPLDDAFVESAIAAPYAYVPGITQMVLPADQAEIAALRFFLGLASVPALESLPLGEIQMSPDSGVQSALEWQAFPTCPPTMPPSAVPLSVRTKPPSAAPAPLSVPAVPPLPAPLAPPVFIPELPPAPELPPTELRPPVETEPAPPDALMPPLAAGSVGEPPVAGPGMPPVPSADA